MAVQYTQSRTAKESTVVKRRCPVCGEMTQVEIAEMTDGWEIWFCRASGCRKDYRVK